MEYLIDLADKVDEELDGAEAYANEACATKDKNREYAKRLHSMAEDELRHAEFFNAAARDHIRAHTDVRELGAVWDFVARRMTKRVERIRTVLDRFPV